MRRLLIFIFLLWGMAAMAQSGGKDKCPFFGTYIKKGEDALNEFNNYKAAINHYSTAMLHCPDSANIARSKILQVFIKIDSLRKSAEEDKKRIILEQEKTFQARKEASFQSSLHIIARQDASLAQAKVDSLTNILDGLKNLYETVQNKDTSINWVTRDSMILIEIGTIISKVQTIKNESKFVISLDNDNLQHISKLKDDRNILNKYFPEIWNVLLLPSNSISKDTSNIIREFSLILQESPLVSMKTLSESSIQAIKRMLIFLGYPTTENGGYLIDEDYGSGLNFGISLFLFENDLIKDNSLKQIDFSKTSWQSKPTPLPELKLMPDFLLALLDSTKNAIETNNLIFRDNKMAINNLNYLHYRKTYDYYDFYDYFGTYARLASDSITKELGISIYPPWILAIMMQETGGVIRPRFERHLLGRMLAMNQNTSFKELRLRATSFGLGQILGDNFRQIGALSATDMFYGSILDQVLYVGRYLAKNRHTSKVVVKTQPSAEDFHTIGVNYNGPGYAKYLYHEFIQSWFTKFKGLFEN